MKLKIAGIVVAVMAVATYCYAQNRTQGSSTAGGGTGVASNAVTMDQNGWVTGPTTLSGTTGTLIASGTNSWIVTSGGVPTETRKPITPAVTLAQVRAASKKVQVSALASQSYLKTAKTIKLNSPAIDEANLVQELYDHGLSVYNYDKVDKFLYNEALKQGTNVRWVWKPLRELDLDATSKSASWSVRPEMGFLYPKVYARAVPERVLNLVADLLECVPDAVFLVSDFEVVKPDPFLAISTPKLLGEDKIFIIAQWDEPGFKDAPGTPVEMVSVHKR